MPLLKNGALHRTALVVLWQGGNDPHCNVQRVRSAHACLDFILAPQTVLFEEAQLLPLLWPPIFLLGKESSELTRDPWMDALSTPISLDGSKLLIDPPAPGTCSEVLRVLVRQNVSLSKGYRSMGFSICAVHSHQDPSHLCESW